ncbi:MAG: peroxiredoxin [Candidatus Heimdallarchaeota archaeon]|nr:peroxiredoxin [Candidatus Heimdallarchaeota archaeon]
MLTVGDKAPEFCLPDENNTEICLHQFKDKWIVLYFYPKDQTPGCTQEACDFTDNYKAFEKLNAVVIGVSADSPESHMKFKQKRALSIILLSDVGLKVIDAYKAKTTSFLGKMISPVKRITYLIDPEGNIAKTWNKVNVSGHTADVKISLEELIK